jgi:diguanylate cyclase (GGDEF)-like protein
MSIRTSYPLALSTSAIVALMALVLLSTFLLSWTWENGAQVVVWKAMGLRYDVVDAAKDHLRFALTSTGFSALSLVIPTAALLWMFRILRSAEAKSVALARHDPMTGLANRRGFGEKLDLLFERPTARFALILLDMDNFKNVNDVHGHAVGDAFLCVVAERLERVTAGHGSVARLGGDEFAVLLQFDDSRAMISRLAHRISAALSLSVDFDGRKLECSASLGVALRGGENQQASDLLRSADIALYRAKRERGGIRFFEPKMEEELEARLTLEADIRASIKANGFLPYYQPFIRLSDGAVVGFEVLARWDHPIRGLQAPDVFIPVAEEIGAVTDLTFSVLRQACVDAKDWPDQPMLSVNISAVDLKDPALAIRLLAILSETDFPPHRIEVEITESAVVIDLALARKFLDDVRVVGIKIALDDFGTGYSSLSKLHQLPFDKIKIDRSFVAASEGTGDGHKFIKLIVTLARSLGVATTAEGIDTAAAANRLTKKGCTFGQGYFFARPMPRKEAERYLASEAHHGVGHLGNQDSTVSTDLRAVATAVSLHSFQAYGGRGS